jgi:hypothetical protein
LDKPSHDKTGRHAAVGVFVSARLLIGGWFVLRELTTPTQSESVETAPSPMRARRIAPVPRVAEDAAEEATPPHTLAPLIEQRYGGAQSLEPEKAIAQMREAASLYREFLGAVQLSEDEYLGWLTSVRKTMDENLFGFSPESYVEIRQRTLVRASMLAAGLAVVREGVGALESYRDLATGQLFTYTQTADEF